MPFAYTRDAPDVVVAVHESDLQISDPTRWVVWDGNPEGLRMRNTSWSYPWDWEKLPPGTVIGRVVQRIR